MRYGLRPPVALYSNITPNTQKRVPRNAQSPIFKERRQNKTKDPKEWMSVKEEDNDKAREKKRRKEKKDSGSRKRKERHLFKESHAIEIGRNVSEQETSRSCWSVSSWISAPVSGFSSPSSSSWWHASGRSNTSGRLRC